jgi:hypothetical protein
MLYVRQLGRDPGLTLTGFISGQLGPSLPAFQELLGVRLVEDEMELWPGRGLRAAWAAQLEPAAAAAAAAATAANSGGAERDGGAGGGGGVSSSGARTTWLTAPRLLLELLPGCKAALLPEAASGACTVAAPLALVHLLALALPPSLVEPMVRALVRCDASGAAALFKWELTTHAQLQAARRPPLLQRLSYAARPGWGLDNLGELPLLLAFSREALPCGPMQLPAGGAGGGPVKQLMAAFCWDEDRATAHFMLPESIAGQCGAWFVTLCVNAGKEAGRGGGGGGGRGCTHGGNGITTLLAVGVSTRLAAVKAQPAEGALAPVRWRALGLPGLQLDMDLVDRIGLKSPAVAAAVTVGAAAGTATSWRGAVHVCEAARSVTVDVLSPGALAATEAAAVTASLEGAQVEVRVKPKRPAGTSRSGGDDGIAEAEFSVQLPPGEVYGKLTDIRLSRKLGLLSARVDMMTATG